MGVVPDPDTEIETESGLLAAIELLAGVTDTVGVVFDDPPQPMLRKPKETVSSRAQSRLFQRRSRPGMKKNNNAASAAPPAARYQLLPVDGAACTIALDATVPTVIVPAALAEELMVTVLPVREIPSSDGPLALRTTDPV